ncbi:hypothetical protein KI387_026981 [Taxus chinensis]|uniref:AAA+ ATPase domain-containing protein n=1 Tax=Taxus chinensis TaxID=29808 RepID=A0AA38L2C5_TAXCH|nr:hypothetical protein KI387_026981 [Taxus chinensis]
MAPRSRKTSSSPSPTADKTPKQSSSKKVENLVPQQQEDEGTIRDALAKASKKYPGFISNDAFHGSIVEVEFKEKSAGCGSTLWMSEAAMFAHSFFPGTCVAVSVAVSVRNFSSDSFPLESLAHLCSKHYNIQIEDGMMDDIGIHFACAIVWPSRKLLKNGVRLSKHLSCTMGSPPLGRTVYVSSLHIHSTSQHAKRIVKHTAPKNDEMYQVSLSECADLSLKWLIPKSALGLSSEISSVDSAGSNGCGNGEFSSPKTPLGYRSMVIPADNITRSRSPLIQSPALNDSPQIQKDEATLFHTGNVERTTSPGFPNLAAIRVVMEDQKLKELLQRYAVRWLSDRILLRGNCVTIPICGQMCVFQLIDAAVSSEKICELRQISEYANSCSFSNALADEEKYVLDTCKPHIVYAGFLVGCETNINFISDLDLASNSQHKEIYLTSKMRDKNGGDREPEKACLSSEGSGVSALGGLSEHRASLKEIINFSLLHPHTLARLGLQPTRGVLLYGPPGTGKTSLASACAFEAGVKIFPINGPELVSEYYGESEQALRAVFKSAEQSAPSVVFIDELDAIAPTRKDGSEDLSQRMVAALLALIDGVNKNHRILVIAATNRPESIDPALRRPGRLDREFEIGVPSPRQRLEILLAILCQMNHCLTKADLQSLATNMHGFVGADINALCNEAAMSALRRYINVHASCNVKKIHCQQLETPGNGHPFAKELSGCNSQDCKISSDYLQYVSGLLSELSLCSDNGKKQVGNSISIQDTYTDGSYKELEDIKARLIEPSLLKITLDDFETAKMKVRPSAMREVMLEIPKVRWCDIGGQYEVKQQLKEAVEWPQKHQHAFLRIGTHPPTGVLMFGPPGCSKTLMARAVASEAGLNFLAVKGPELLSKWVGESEKAVRSLFAKARAASPSIIFFDEIDGLAVAREQRSNGVSVGDRVMTQLLVEMDGLSPRIGVTVIAATNRPDKVDAAILRPGRFDRLVYVGPPNQADREEIFYIHTRKMPCGCDVRKPELASLTDGFTGADIAAVCREAAIAALEENIDIQEVSMRHFETALAQVQPSDLSEYKNLSSRFQRLISSHVVQ